MTIGKAASYLAAAFLAVATLLGAAPAALAQAPGSIRLSAPFEPSALDRPGTRILQAALALDRTYEGLLDGAWGSGSRAALEAATASGRPSWGQVQAILARFEAARQADGWRGIWHRDTGVWHLRPDALLRREDGPAETRYLSDEGGLVILERRDRARPDALADAFEADARAGAAPYRLERPDRLVFAAQMVGGRHVYLRSDRAGDTWETHVVLADEENRGRLQLIASSFSRRQAAGVEPERSPVVASLLAGDASASAAPAPYEAPVPSSTDELVQRLLLGALDRILDRAEEREARSPAARADTAPTSRRPVPPPPSDRDALGFFVNTTDIVASANFVQGCDRLRRAGGADLARVAVDAASGVAVLAAPGRSGAWLPLAPGRPARDSAVFVLGLNGGREGDLRVVGGRVLGDDPGRGTLDATATLAGRDQIGAPMVDDTGRVLGLWQDGQAGAGRSGTLAALRIAEVLERARVPFATGVAGVARPDFDKGIPADVRGAVVALRCDGR